MKRLFLVIFAILGIVKFGTKVATEAVANVTNENMASIWDLNKPQVSDMLMKKFGNEDASMLQHLRLTSREEAVALDEWSAYEDERTVDNLKIGSIVTDATSAGDPVIFKLHTDRITAGQYFYARKDFIVTVPVINTQCIITDITVNAADDVDITITPLDSTNLAGVLSTGVELSITNGAWAAGTGSPDSAVKGAVKREFIAQIFKESIGAEGTQLANQKWFDLNSLYKDEKGWFTPALAQIQYRLSVIEDGAYLMGVHNTNSITSVGMNNSTNSVKTTKGIVPWIEDLGSDRTYTVGSFAMTDLDSTGLYLRTQSVPTDMISLMNGATFNNELENVLQTYLGTNQGGADMSRVAREYYAKSSLDSGKSEEGLKWAMDIGWQSVKKGSFTFVFQTMGLWSNPKLFGATGYDLLNYGIGMPLTSVKDKKSGKSTMNIASRYRAYNGTSRKYKLYNLVGGGNTLPGSTGNTSVNDLDQVNTNLAAHHGLQVTAANWMFMHRPA